MTGKQHKKHAVEKAVKSARDLWTTMWIKWGQLWKSGKLKRFRPIVFVLSPSLHFLSARLWTVRL